VLRHSNTGYTVLGWLVAAIEQRPLGDVLSDRLFAPLGMRRARYRASLDADPLRARAHAVSAEGAARHIDHLTGGFGSGGMSMSAADVAALGVAVQSGRFLSLTMAAEAWRPARLANGRGVAMRR